MTFRILVLLACGTLLACDLEDTKTDTGELPVVDEDGDGFAAADDCDDTDAAINPDAAEACDGADNNCDGSIDEGVQITVYTDADGDGYGDDGSASDACAAEAGFSEAAGDCDDADAAVSPAVAEICDSIDNDCDGLIDDDDDSVDLSTGVTFYADADGDGFGDAGAAVQSCDLQAGIVADATDCDDLAAETYPGAVEVCVDGVVNDCDSTVEAALEACEDSVDHDEDVVIRGSSSINLGYGTNPAGDFNGDGFDDIMVGAVTAGEDANGATYIFYGSASGAGEYTEADADVTLVGAPEGSQGVYSAALGDLNGDGYDDILSGAYSIYDEKADIEGGAYIVYGGTTGGDIVDESVAFLHGTTASPIYSEFNQAAADFDDDGFTDVVLNGVYSTLYVFSGATTGTASIRDASAVITPTKSNYLYSSAALDLDGDGTTDLAVCDITGAGASMPSIYGFSGADLNGEVIGSDASATISSGTSGAVYVCFSMANMGDANGDGYDDLLAGDIAATSALKTGSSAYIFFGPFSGARTVPTADATLSATYTGAYLGYGVGGGDFDGDGRADALITEPLYTDSAGTTVGAAYLLYGEQLSGALSTDDAIMLSGDSDSYNYGTSAKNAGDYNGDGFDDMLISSFVGNILSEGDAHIIYGGARY